MPRRASVKKTPAQDAPVFDDYGIATGQATSVEVIHSGCTLLDLSLGGGWAMGRFVNIVGDKSTGKTLLAMECMANFRNAYPTAPIFYNEPEAAFDDVYAKSLGIDVDGIGRGRSLTVRDFHEHIRSWVGDVKGDTPSLYIVDSLDALADADELENDVDKASFGTGKAKQFAKMFQQIIQPLNDKRVTFIAISQVRDNINAGMFGKKNVRAGGRALDFYASQVVWLAPRGAITKQVKTRKWAVGVKVHAKCEKNKIGMPFRYAEFPIIFNYGIDDYTANLDFLKSIGFDKRKEEFLAEGDGQSCEKFKTWTDGATLPDVKRAPLANAMRDTVIREWSEIESNLLPERRQVWQLILIGKAHLFWIACASWVGKNVQAWFICWRMIGKAGKFSPLPIRFHPVATPRLPPAPLRARKLIVRAANALRGKWVAVSSHLNNYRISQRIGSMALNRRLAVGVYLLNAIKEHNSPDHTDAKFIDLVQQAEDVARVAWEDKKVGKAIAHRIGLYAGRYVGYIAKGSGDGEPFDFVEFQNFVCDLVIEIAWGEPY